LERIDIIVHISIADSQRNVDLYTSEDQDEFDTFAPGLRDAINFKAMSKTTLRSAVLNCWSDQVTGLGSTKAKHSEPIKGPANQRLYWLCLRSRDRLTQKLWGAIGSAAKRPVMMWRITAHESSQTGIKFQHSVAYRRSGQSAGRRQELARLLGAIHFLGVHVGA
jgi:hypothetical protein